MLKYKYPTRFGYEFTPVPDASRFIVSWLVEEDDPVLRARIDSEVANNLPSFMEMVFNFEIFYLNFFLYY